MRSATAPETIDTAVVANIIWYSSAIAATGGASSGANCAMPIQPPRLGPKASPQPATQKITPMKQVPRYTFMITLIEFLALDSPPLDQRKAGLHEEHQGTAHGHPGQVDQVGHRNHTKG
jgi:hypothetical protein